MIQTYDRVVGASCTLVHNISTPVEVESESQCRELCNKDDECYSVEYIGRDTYYECQLQSQCLQRRPQRHQHVMHRWRFSKLPSEVKWKTNATLVISTYKSKFYWLRNAPPRLFDVAVYFKIDFGNAWEPTGYNVKLYRQYLSYTAQLPNYGEEVGAIRGGSREPYVYIRFILDFWRNMPNVVVFAQDDTGPRIEQLASTLPRWQDVFHPIQRPTALNCACNYKVEPAFNNASYLYHSLMRAFALHVYKTKTEFTRNDKRVHLTWPICATFAVAGSSIRATPKWVYKLLHRVTTVEYVCVNNHMDSTIRWAHSIERMWFDIFDPSIQKYHTERRINGCVR